MKELKKKQKKGFDAPQPEVKKVIKNPKPTGSNPKTRAKDTIKEANVVI